jgi:hypothetical protein
VSSRLAHVAQNVPIGYVPRMALKPAPKTHSVHARLADTVLDRTWAIALKSRWTLSVTIGVLVEEALEHRDEEDKPAATPQAPVHPAKIDLRKIKAARVQKPAPLADEERANRIPVDNAFLPGPLRDLFQTIAAECFPEVKTMADARALGPDAWNGTGRSTAALMKWLFPDVPEAAARAKRLSRERHNANRVVSRQEELRLLVAARAAAQPR